MLLAQACGGADGPAGRAGRELAVRIAGIAASGADLTDRGTLAELAVLSGDTVLLAGVTPVALAYPAEPAAMVAAIQAVAELTGAGPVTAEACVLGCAGIAAAVRTGSFDGVRAGLELLRAGSRDRWARWLAEAEQTPPPTRPAPDAGPVAVLQAAYAAVRHTPVPPDTPAEGSFACLHLQHALASARAAGPTAAALAGALLGARWGASAVPFGWRRNPPGLPARTLVGLAVLAARGGEPDPQGWPRCDRMPYQVPALPAVAHPCDEGVLLGNAAAISDADAVVALCRRGRREVPAPGVAAGDHIEVRLQDRTDPAENPNLEFVLDDAARAVATLRDEGRRVLLHCVHGQSRTPTVAARYAVLRGSEPAAALGEVFAVLPGARANPTLRRALVRLGPPRRPSRTTGTL